MIRDYSKKKWGNLFPEDKELHERMKGNYISANEEEFFENQLYKQQYVPTGMNDLVMHEKDNEDGIYIEREGFGEYLVGRIIDGHVIHEFHVMTLSEALAVNLKELELGTQDITLHEWLRKRDYKNVRYDHNFDNLY